MKILLLNPPGLDQSNYGKHFRIDGSPPLSLSYLYSYLKSYDYNCKIFDFFFDKWDYIERILRKESADIIGITCLTESRYNALKLLYLIRKIKSDTIIIFGGHHSTYMYEQLLENFSIDYIVLGEGEKKLLNLIRAIEGKIPLESVSGIAYKKNGVVIKKESDEIENFIDLNNLPFPFSEEQLHLFNKYPPLNKAHPSDIKTIDNISWIYERGKATRIITSRGCPFNCQFCSATLFWGKKYRFRSPKNVVDEIEYYYKNLGFKFFKFSDYSFTIIPERSIEICKEIINRNLKIFFTCQSRADSINEDLLYWLKKAGCLYLTIGVESGSRKILEEINKKITIESVKKAFYVAKIQNMPAICLLMVGNPGETNKTINKTIKLMKIIKPYRISTSKITIFPGTELYSLAKKQGFIDDNFWLTSKPEPFYTVENSLKTLKKWEFEINFYNRKKIQLKILKSIYKIKNFLKPLIKKKRFEQNSKSIINQIYNVISEKVIKLFQINSFIF